MLGLTNLFEPASHYSELAMHIIIATAPHNMADGKSREVTAHLGENVVNEKEYLSAMVSIDSEIDSWAIPKVDRRRERLVRSVGLRKVERWNCCRY